MHCHKLLLSLGETSDGLADHPGKIKQLLLICRRDGRWSDTLEPYGRGEQHVDNRPELSSNPVRVLGRQDKWTLLLGGGESSEEPVTLSLAKNVFCKDLA